jgi:hypothetical protein
MDQQLRQADAAVLQTQAAAAKAASDLERAKVDYGRYERLAGTGAVAAQDVDKSRSDLSVAQANLETAKANVAAAQASVQRLRVVADAASADDFDKLVAKPDADLQIRVGREALAIRSTSGADPLWGWLATHCFYSAALSGDPVGAREYAKQMDGGRDGQPVENSARWWTQAADKGDPEALAHLGRSK